MIYESVERWKQHFQKNGGGQLCRTRKGFTQMRKTCESHVLRSLTWKQISAAGRSSSVSVIWIQQDTEQVCRLLSAFLEAQAVELISRRGCKRVCVLSEGKVRTFRFCRWDLEQESSTRRKQSSKFHFEVLAKAMGYAMHSSCQSFYYLSFSF